MPYKDPKKRKAQAKRYRNRPDIRPRLLAYHRMYNRKYESKYSPKRRAKQWAMKLTVLNYYSNNNMRCACCGVPEPEFNTIDHIKGRGKRLRKRLGLPAGYVFYGWLIKNNFPPGFRVLCLNCNFAWGVYGVCPHVLDRIRIAMEKYF